MLPDPHDRISKLSPREQEIACAIAHGRKPSSIAAQLSLRRNTVNNYRTRILKKLQLRSTACLAILAYRAGLVAQE